MFAASGDLIGFQHTSDAGALQLAANRNYICVVCGEIRRAPLPPGLMRLISAQEQARRQRLHGTAWPEQVARPVPYGHWRNWVVALPYALPAWLHHCSEPLFLLGTRAAQAAAQLTAADRLVWISLGYRVTEHAGARRWRPILKETGLKHAYPLV